MIHLIINYYSPADVNNKNRLKIHSDSPSFKFEHASEIYNIENYDIIMSFQTFQLRKIIESFKPNKFMLPKKLKYFSSSLRDADNTIIKKEDMQYIVFPEQMLKINIICEAFDIDLNTEIDKLIIGYDCHKILTLPKSVKYLTCGGSDVYYGNPYLEILPDLLPQNLVYLDCSRGKLTELPELPDTLEYLLCDTNYLTELPKLPPNLKELICFSNRLKKLPELPKSIVYLNCADNNIDEIPLSLAECKLSKSLHYCEVFINRRLRSHYINHYNPDCNCRTISIFGSKTIQKRTNVNYFRFIYNDNPLVDIIKNVCKGKDRNNRKVRKYLFYKKVKPYVLKIEEWFLDCKYNPKYLYCQRRLENEFIEIHNE